MHTVWNILWWRFTKNRSFSIPLIVNQSHNYVFFLLHKRGSVERNEFKVLVGNSQGRDKGMSLN